MRHGAQSCNSVWHLTAKIWGLSESACIHQGFIFSANRRRTKNKVCLCDRENGSQLWMEVGANSHANVLKLHKNVAQRVRTCKNREKARHTDQQTKRRKCNTCAPSIMQDLAFSLSVKHHRSSCRRGSRSSGCRRGGPLTRSSRRISSALWFHKPILCGEVLAD